MPWYFYLALKQLFPTGRFPFFTAISMTGVALGVAVLIVVTSVMSGFAHQVREMIVDTEGEVQVTGNGGLANVADMMARVKATPGVAAATPYIKGPVAVLSGNNPAYPFFYGVDPKTVESVAHLSRFIVAGSIHDLDDDSVIVSWRLAKAIGAGLGSSVDVYSPLAFEKMKNDEVLLPKRFRVVGILQVNHQQLDSQTIYGTLRAMQELYGLGSAVHGINVRLAPGVSEVEGARRLTANLPSGVRAITWLQTWDDFLWALNLEKTINFFLLLIVVVIAAFSVMSSLLISVVRKTREIGLLGALGGRTRDVALCFCVQAFLIGTAGTVLGLGLGFLVLALRNQIVHGIARALGREETLTAIYQFSDLPSHPMQQDIVMTIVAAIVISTLAGLLPAWRAARLKPVEALRSE